MTRLSKAQAADCRNHIKNWTLESLIYSAHSMAADGGWNSYTPHKLEILHGRIRQMKREKERNTPITV